MMSANRPIRQSLVEPWYWQACRVTDLELRWRAPKKIVTFRRHFLSEIMFWIRSKWRIILIRNLGFLPPFAVFLSCIFLLCRRWPLTRKCTARWPLRHVETLSMNRSMCLYQAMRHIASTAEMNKDKKTVLSQGNHAMYRVCLYCQWLFDCYLHTLRKSRCECETINK